MEGDEEAIAVSESTRPAKGTEGLSCVRGSRDWLTVGFELVSFRNGRPSAYPFIQFYEVGNLKGRVLETLSFSIGA